MKNYSRDSYPSKTRDKLIAVAFYLMGDIEKCGSGYLPIILAINEYPSMKFDYLESGDGFMVTINYDFKSQRN